jgi:hypothetical protein
MFSPPRRTGRGTGTGAPAPARRRLPAAEAGTGGRRCRASPRPRARAAAAAAAAASLNPPQDDSPVWCCIVWFSFLFFFFIILVAIFVTVSRRCDSVSWFGLDVREVERWMEGDFTLVVRFHLVFSLSLSLFSFGA